MENVPDMGLGDDFRVIRIMVDALETAGYRTKVQLTDAWRYGVPQHRKRLILLARRDGYDFTWPDEQPTITTLRESIGDLPKLGGSRGSREMAYVQESEISDFASRMRLGATPGVLHDHMTRGVRDDDLEVFRLMDSKTLYSDIPEHLRRYNAESFDDKYKRLDWDSVSRSITAHIAKDGYWYIHPEEHRTLTVREAARIQTFPDAFRFSGARSDAFRQIGNAVPPLLGEAAARALLPADEGATVAPTDWLSARKALTRWAKAQQKTARWFMFPGAAVTPPVAAAAAVTSSALAEPARTGDGLRYLRGLGTLDAATLRCAIDSLAGSKAGQALERLRPLVRRKSVWRTPEVLPEVIGLKPGETQLFRMLQGEDVMLRSQGVLRVAARVAGTRSDETNRLTDGRIDLARLVGSGPEAPLRMAAIRVLGATRCGVSTSDCGGCPLAAWCNSAQSTTPSAPAA